MMKKIFYNTTPPLQDTYSCTTRGGAINCGGTLNGGQGGQELIKLLNNNNINNNNII